MKIDHLFFESRIDLFGAIIDYGYVSKAAKAANISHAHSAKLVDLFESSGLIKRIKEWGKRMVKLEVTPYGKLIWSHIKIIRGVMQNEN